MTAPSVPWELRMAFRAYNAEVKKARDAYRDDPLAASRLAARHYLNGMARRLDPVELAEWRAEVDAW